MRKAQLYIRESRVGEARSLFDAGEGHLKLLSILLI